MTIETARAGQKPSSWPRSTVFGSPGNGTRSSPFRRPAYVYAT